MSSTVSAATSSIDSTDSTEFLIPEGFDFLAPLLDHTLLARFKIRPSAYRSEDRRVDPGTNFDGAYCLLAKTRRTPEVIEEKLSPLIADILLIAERHKNTSADFHRAKRSEWRKRLEDFEFRAAIDFLTTQERQLIKFTPRLDDLTILLHTSI